MWALAVFAILSWTRMISRASSSNSSRSASGLPSKVSVHASVMLPPGRRRRATGWRRRWRDGGSFAAESGLHGLHEAADHTIGRRAVVRQCPARDLGVDHGRTARGQRRPERILEFRERLDAMAIGTAGLRIRRE